MTPSLIILRYLVTCACGWLVQHGWTIANLDGPTMDAVTSIAAGVLGTAAMAAIGVWQSTVKRVLARLVARHKSELIGATAALPEVSAIQTTAAVANAQPSDKVVPVSEAR